jgi:hypothetical protein
LIFFEAVTIIVYPHCSKVQYHDTNWTIVKVVLLSSTTRSTIGSTSTVLLSTIGTTRVQYYSCGSLQQGTILLSSTIRSTIGSTSSVLLRTIGTTCTVLFMWFTAARYNMTILIGQLYK